MVTHFWVKLSHNWKWVSLSEWKSKPSCLMCLILCSFEGVFKFSSIVLNTKIWKCFFSLLYLWLKLLSWSLKLKVDDSKKYFALMPATLKLLLQYDAVCILPNGTKTHLRLWKPTFASEICAIVRTPRHG